MSEVASPCVRVCRMDLDAGVCVGCLRTMDEISFWTRLSGPERQAVLAKLEPRRRELEARAGWAASTCERCGARFSCGAQAGGEPCWCVGYPPVTPAGSRCLCPTCLSSVEVQY
jgi:uncharacterized protein